MLYNERKKKQEKKLVIINLKREKFVKNEKIRKKKS